MGFYDNKILPHIIDCVCGLGDIMKQRSLLVPRAHGRVLEIGIGTGLNLEFYDASRVQHICGVDPATGMHSLARKRAAKISIPVETVPLVVQEIQAEAASFDSIVCTFTMCTIPDVVPALQEMRRVLKPGGEFLFCEHGRAPDEGVRRWQDRLTPMWKPLAGGCHLNRNIPALLEQGGFHVRELQTQYLPGPKPMTYVYSGSASPQ